jgi:hypothetical protein
MVTAAELISPNNIVEIKAKIITYDENDIPFTSETVKYFDLNNNTSYTNSLNPVIEIDPELTVDDIRETIENDSYLWIGGCVSGDAKKDDNVILFINSLPNALKVIEDYSLYPDTKIDYSDLYYLAIIYFNGIYRTNPEDAEEVGEYEKLTDINFDLNKYSMILNIKEFFTKQFIYFLKTPPGSLPFANDFGTSIKKVVQTKNNIVQEIQIQNEINFFINAFNDYYGELVQINQIIINRQSSDIGADSWLIEVFAKIIDDHITYRLEI